MKHHNLLLATGYSIPEAVTALQNQIEAEGYLNQACQLQQIFLLPEYRQAAPGITTTTTQPAVQIVYNLVAVITEEPELDALQRNYKQLFDFINDNREAFMPALIGYLGDIAAAIPAGLKVPGTDETIKMSRQ